MIDLGVGAHAFQAVADRAKLTVLTDGRRYEVKGGLSVFQRSAPSSNNSLIMLFTGQRLELRGRT